MESAARVALNQFRVLVARRGRDPTAAATAGTFTVAARARHLSSTTTTTGAKGSSSLDKRAVADRATAAGEFRKADPPAEPRLYIVYLDPTGIKHADVDVSKAAELHQGILSSVVGSLEEATRCMVRSFAYCNAFSAMLNDSQARAISDLPGVLGASPNRSYILSNPTIEANAFVEQLRIIQNAARHDAERRELSTPATGADEANNHGETLVAGREV